MYQTAEIAREQHQRDMENAAQTRQALRIRALGRATRRVRRAEHRVHAARAAAARLRTEINS
jgi:hypothetical protein